MVITKILVGFGSLASIAFGVWHFFVPKAWKWYSYMDPAATELAVAVRAINVFFSLSLVLFGLLNIILVFSKFSNQFSISVLLGATCVLWLTRLIFQIVYPQGSFNPVVQYGMLIAFVLVNLCYLVSMGLVITQKQVLK